MIAVPVLECISFVKNIYLKRKHDYLVLVEIKSWIMTILDDQMMVKNSSGIESATRIPFEYDSNTV